MLLKLDSELSDSTQQCQFCSLLILNVSFQQGNKLSISLKIQSKLFKEKAEINLSEFFFVYVIFAKHFRLILS